MTDTAPEQNPSPEPNPIPDEPEAARVASPGRRRLVLGGLGAVATVPALGACMGASFAAPPYQGPTSPHFNGDVFTNPYNKRDRGFLDVVKWQLTSDAGKWGPYENHPPGPLPPRRVTGGDVRLTFVNHSTLLLQMDGLNILTDPIWSERCSPISWLGPRRVRPPGIRFEDLPPIDVVLLSHNHYDHLDIPTLLDLRKHHAPKFYTPLGNRSLLNSHKVDGAKDLDWWDTVDLAPAHGTPAVSGVTLTCVPAEHWSGRGTTDRGKTLWGGYTIKSPSGLVYFAGDTGYSPLFNDLHNKFGAPRLALLPIGAWLPRWFMKPVHMSPADAMQAHRDLHAGVSAAFHYGTFRLADDGQGAAERVLAEHIADATDFTPDDFWCLDFGEGRDVPPVTA